MDKLPAETIAAITYKLDLYDKLTCCLVCRKWCQIIYSSNLYTKLSFRFMSDFNKAVTFFQSNLHMAQLVKELTCITDCCLDTTTILSLPGLFPNMESLNLNYFTCGATNTTTLVANREQGLVKWSHLKRLEDFTDMGISRFLLGSSVYENLVELKVHLSSATTQAAAATAIENNNSKIPPLQPLIRHLKNAPNLQKLNLRHATVSLLDLESLHTNAPNLRSLKINKLTMPVQEDLNLNSVSPADNLQQLKVCFDNANAPDPVYLVAVTQYLNYFQKKYTNMTDIRLSLGSFQDDLDDPWLFEQFIINLISNMPLLTSYSMEICPLTERIAAAMDEKRLQLSQIQLYVDEDEQLEILSACKAAQTLTTLNLTKSNARIYIYDVIKVNPTSLVEIGQRLEHLTTLKFDNVDNGPCFIFDIIGNMPRVTSLSFDTLLFPNTEAEHDPSTRPIHFCNIKHLNIMIISNKDGQELTDQLNNTFKYFLDCCPLLESFVFRQAEGWCLPLGELNFDLSQHKHIKSIAVERYNEQYFTFSHLPEKAGKRFKDFHHEVDENDLDDFIVDGVECYINVIWQGQVDLNLE